MSHATRARARRVAPVACLFVSGLLLASCGGTSSDASSPRLVTPSTLGGSSGIGPRVLDDAAASPGTPSGELVASLADRTLTVVASSRRASAQPGFTVIAVDVIVQNRSGGAIANDATSFQLTGSSGDAFAARDGSNPFFAPVAVGVTAHGSVEFDIPAASDSQLRLMYRADDVSGAVVVPLFPRAVPADR